MDSMATLSDTPPLTLGLIFLGIIIVVFAIVFSVLAIKRVTLIHKLDRQRSVPHSTVIQAMQTVARQHNQKAIPYLVQWLPAPPSMSMHAANALRALGWQPTDAELGLRFDYLLKNYASVVAKGDIAVKPLAQWLQYGDGTAAELLGQIGTKKAIDALISIIDREKDIDLRRAALSALVITYQSHQLTPAAKKLILPHLESWLDRPKDEIAMDAAQGLRAIGWHPASVDQALCCDLILRDYVAVVARGDAAVPLLAGTYYTDAETSSELLGEIGTHKAVTALTGALQDPSTDRRRIAATALVTAYQSNRLTPSTKQLILKHQAEITAPHEDRTSYHEDRGSRQSHHSDYTSYSDCHDGHSDGLVTDHRDMPNSHVDRGIGVKFSI